MTLVLLYLHVGFVLFCILETYVYVFFNLQYVLALHTDSVPTCEHQIWGDDYECKTQGGGGQGEPKILYKQGWDTCI